MKHSQPASFAARCPAAETLTADFSHAVVTPNQLRWRPFAIPEDPVDFVRGLFTICGAGRWACCAVAPRWGAALWAWAAGGSLWGVTCESCAASAA